MFVMAGLDPAIHDEALRMTFVRSSPLHGLMDARVKPAHDAECVAGCANYATYKKYFGISDHFSRPR